MNASFFEQICEANNLGHVIIDRDFVVTYWNRWMEVHSQVSASRIVGSNLFDFYPGLREPWFQRLCRTVFAFGNYVFLSEKLHHGLFPFPPVAAHGLDEEYMPQSCSIYPLRGDDESVVFACITVSDVTGMVSYEKKIQDLGQTDALTGLFNRRYLDERMKGEFERHRRYGRPLSLIVLDLDGFRKINEALGHDRGDEVLRATALIIRSQLRAVDLLVRYGGEEFCCVLPETNLPNALLVAERIRSAIAGEELRIGDRSIRTTVSLGVAGSGGGVDSPDMLFRLVDDALYSAKTRGGNQVVAVGPPEVFDSLPDSNEPASPQTSS